MIRHIKIDSCDKSVPHFSKDSERLFIDSARQLTLALYFLESGIIRVVYYHGAIIEDVPSYGVSELYHSVPDVIQREYRIGQYSYIETELLKVVIDNLSFEVSFYDCKTGTLISSDKAPYSNLSCDVGCREKPPGALPVILTKNIKRAEHFFGLGDKPTMLNLRGKQFELWGVDHYNFRENADPLYKNIPFFVSICEKITYGIFFDNTSRVHIDFGFAQPDELVLSAPCGLMNYYFIYQRKALDVVAAYTRLTGLPEMPPRWALGYHQSKWSYHPESEVKEVAHLMRYHRIPCDVIHLDHHYMKNKENFTWNYDEFPNPPKMIRQLGKQGFKVVAILNPGIKVNQDSEVWKEGIEKNYFCRRSEGHLLQADVWPGLCHFPDFTSASVRTWWASLLKSLVKGDGIKGIWVDMNEPVVFPNTTFPLDTRHHFDGRPCSHHQAHNVYGQCMVEATQSGLKTFLRTYRPFVLSRSGYAGMQRSCATWTGDNVASWNHLKLANYQCQRLATSGISFAGSDVGGFLDNPTGELMCRWTQLASFHLFFRNHSAGNVDQEPWSYDENVLSIIRETIEQRYRLIPYFYTQFYKYSTKGLPIIRSLALQCCQVTDTYWRSAEFFVGDHLYIAPILEPHEEGRYLYIPDGLWYCYHNDHPINQGDRDIWVDCPLSCIPVYVRGGAIIPHWPLQQYIGELATPDLTMDLWWAPQQKVTSDLYEDSGDGYEYLSEEYCRHEWIYESTKDSEFTLIWNQVGQSRKFHEQAHLIIHGVPARIHQINVKVDDDSIRMVKRLGNNFELRNVPEFKQITVWW